MVSENAQISFCYMWLSSFSSTTYSVLVTQSHPTFWPYGVYCLPGSSVHGILQARILESVAIAFSRKSSWPRDQTQVSCMAGILYHLNQRLFFSIVYSHLLCHRLIDGEYVGLLPGFLSCSWIFTKKRIYFFPLELQKSTSCPWGAHSAQNEGMNPSVKQLISTACFTSNPKNGDV